MRLSSSNTFTWCSGFPLWVMVLVVTSVLLGTLSLTSQSVFCRVGNKYQISARFPLKGNGNPPVIAYWISSTNGEKCEKMLRLLKAIYHPRNQYLLQLDADSSGYEREQLALYVQSQGVFRTFDNVNVVGQSYGINHMGSSSLAATLHAAALLLKLSADWDWFIALSSSDYPLMPQDDLLHALTSLPRNLNFVHFTDKTGWKEQKRVEKIVLDPTIHLQNSTPLSTLNYSSNITREIPDSFKVFGGSPWGILSRDFMEYCVQGWDNLPRELLMYLSNVVYPLDYYFHTIICNSPEFQNSLVDNDLSFTVWNLTAFGETQVLNMSHYEQMLASEAAFARPFHTGDQVLNKIDESVLNRSSKGLVPGEWCLGEGRSMGLENSADDHEELCSTWVNINSVNPGSRGISLAALLTNLIVEGRFTTSHCQEHW
uniref:xylosyltransferase 1-like n=1 Tax=Fragaria vesca subsp. vesca TaxID=101020 RepID=UPI0005C98941|nr:PREDICTED: xylosyltransferase 1-like [Fragaria vesca subsp. vesca]